MANDRLNQTGLAIRDAMDVWLSQHRRELAKIFHSAVQEAASAWINEHSDQIIEGIVRRTAAQQPDAG
jgi:hypothetical protein